MECEFCKNIFISKTNLNQHQKRAKYCLKLRGENKEEPDTLCPPNTPVTVARRTLNIPALPAKSESKPQLGRHRLLYIIHEDCSDTTKPER